jgi:hypothetical protein
LQRADGEGVADQEGGVMWGLSSDGSSFQDIEALLDVISDLCSKCKACSGSGREKVSSPEGGIKDYTRTCSECEKARDILLHYGRSS